MELKLFNWKQRRRQHKHKWSPWTMPLKADNIVCFWHTYQQWRCCNECNVAQIRTFRTMSNVGIDHVNSSIINVKKVTFSSDSYGT